MITAVLRSYQIAGNADWLNTATAQWNATYNRGWTTDGGGGIWEAMDPTYSKCALSNDPMISTAVSLYQITGDGTYLTKAEAIYDWVRGHIVDTSSGVVNECVAFPKGTGGSTVLQASDNAYNGGSFIEAADNLYRATGNTGYWCDRLDVEPLDEPHQELDTSLDVLARLAVSANSVAKIRKCFDLYPELQTPADAVAR